MNEGSDKGGKEWKEVKGREKRWKREREEKKGAEKTGGILEGRTIEEKGEVKDEMSDHSVIASSLAFTNVNKWKMKTLLLELHLTTFRSATNAPLFIIILL
ncbi:unnamed protein product [Rhizophagus irregularis]|uniref:Uncharacterized protein n=1 Tax=Rhizophagus irregularis TaxID=588596 RepID=A0A915YT36_9GLOM|nr:unnamed protein product [Rhizophagus irregularis]CAB5331160.1 unnamed protein product [Rhizophagus irregularis]